LCSCYKGVTSTLDSYFARLSNDEVNRSRWRIANGPRNVAIYLLRFFRGDNLLKIGREFNITLFSQLSIVVERMRGKISGDRQVRKCVE
jgi:chromosomal replication initiation ATPase DnaA